MAVAGFSAKLEGAPALMAQMEALDQKVQRRLVKKAVRAGGQPVARAAKAKAPKGKGPLRGLLKKSIGLRITKGRKTGDVLAVIGARKGFRMPLRSRRILTGRFAGAANAARQRAGKNVVYQNPQKYIHLVELGTSHSAAQPFLRPALDTQGPTAVARIAEVLKQGIEEGTK